MMIVIYYLVTLSFLLVIVTSFIMVNGSTGSYGEDKTDDMSRG